MQFSLIIPSFVAGILTFLAPCTLPLVPGYLVFISGASWKDLQDPEKVKTVRWKIFLNGVMYVIGFTIIFMTFGLIFSAGGVALGVYRIWLERIGGVLVILFGLHLMNLLNYPWLRWMNAERRLPIVRRLTPGRPWSAFIFGASFALGWTACIGPILGTILFLASSNSTIFSGVVLLFVYSIGFAIPFLLVAGFIGQASYAIRFFSKYLGGLTVASGAFIVFLGVLLVSGNLFFWTSFAFSILHFFHI